MNTVEFVKIEDLGCWLVAVFLNRVTGETFRLDKSNLEFRIANLKKERVPHEEELKALRILQKQLAGE